MNNNITDNVYILRFHGDKQIKPIYMYKYFLDLSQADKDEEETRFFNSMCRNINKSNREYHAVWHNKHIYTLSSLEPGCYTYNNTIGNKSNTLTLKDEKYEIIPLAENEVYEKLLTSLIKRNLLGINKQEKMIYFEFDYKIACDYIPFFDSQDTYKTGRYKKIGNEMYHLCRIFDIKSFVYSDGSFEITVDLKSKINSNSTILDLHKNGHIVEGLTAKPLPNISALGLFDITGTVTTVLKDNGNPKFNTTSGLYQYFIDKYNKILPKPYGDFVVQLVRRKGERNSYLASTVYPIYDYQTIKSFKHKGVKEVQENLKINMRRRIQEASLIVDQVGTIPELSDVGFHKIKYNNDFYIMPRLATSCGFVVSTIANPTLIIGDKDTPITTKDKKRIFNYGVHRKPKIMRDNKIVKFIVVSMTKWQIPQDILIRAATNIIKDSIGHIYSMEKMNITYACYDKSKEISEVSFAKRIKKEYNPDIILGIVDDNKEQYDFDHMESNEYTEMKEAFAENSIAIPSQMLAYKTFQKYLNDPESAHFISNNICLGILGKLGGMAYKLKDNPNNIDLYIGLDVGATKQNTRVPCCAAAFIGHGDFVGVMAPRDFTTGEIIPNEILKKIFDRMIAQYTEVFKKLPQRIVIHRDGFCREDLSWFESYFGKLNIKYQIVEIRKQGAERFCIRKNSHDNNESFNPKPGTVLYDYKNNEANLVSSIPISGGSPNPVTIKIKDGNLGLSIQEVATQVYWLTKISDSSLHDTRLPLTIRYADKISKHPNFIPLDEVVVKKYFI